MTYNTKYASLEIGQRSVLRNIYEDMPNSPISFPMAIPFSTKGNIIIGNNGRGKTVLLKHLAAAATNNPRDLEFLSGSKPKKGEPKIYDESFRQVDYAGADHVREYSMGAGSRIMVLDEKGLAKYKDSKHGYTRHNEGSLRKPIMDKRKFDALTVKGTISPLSKQNRSITTYLDDDGFRYTSNERPVVSFLDMNLDLKKIDVDTPYGQEGESWRICDAKGAWKNKEGRQLSDDLVSIILYFQPFITINQRHWDDSQAHGEESDEYIPSLTKKDKRQNLSHGEFNIRYIEDYLGFIRDGTLGPQGGILVIDEADSGISGRNIARMAKALEDLVKMGKHQLFVSTHSASLLEQLPRDWSVYDLNESPLAMHTLGDLTPGQIKKMLEG